MDDLDLRAGAAPEHKREQRSQVLRLVVGASLAAALLLFVVQNTQTVQLNWLTFTFETQQWVLVLVVVAVSIGLAKVGGQMYRRSRAKSRKAKDAAEHER